MKDESDSLNTPFGPIPWDKLQNWLSGFVRKEYVHLPPQEIEDLVQVGCVKFIEIAKELHEKVKNSNTTIGSKNECVLYLKACARHAIRDYILRDRSRFNVSLFKLRKHLKKTNQELNEYMTEIERDYVFSLSDIEDWETEEEKTTRQVRLDILSQVKKHGIGISVEQNRKTLKMVIDEYRSHLIKENRLDWDLPKNDTRKPIRHMAVKNVSPHVRTPVFSPDVTPRRAFICNSVFCKKNLSKVKTPVIFRGHVYCSNACKRECPPSVFRSQVQFEAPIHVIVQIATILYKSRKRVSEIVGIPISTLSRISSIENAQK